MEPALVKKRTSSTATDFNPPKVWSKKTNFRDTRRYLEFPEDINFCAIVNNSHSDVEVIRRIGSESSEGEVYQIRYNNVDAALKIMPVISDSDILKNENEINIANLASQMVLQNKWPHFPMVYGSGKCTNSNFYNPRWKELSHDYACVRRLREVLPAKNKQIDALYRTGQQPENIAQRFGLNLEVCQNLKTPSNFLISELATEDLSSWATAPHTTREWREIVRQCLDSISFLHQEMAISHNDLHWGNVLIKDIALIHDFGKSSPFVEENANDDLVKFISSWTGQIYRIPESLRELFLRAEDQIKTEATLDEIRKLF